MKDRLFFLSFLLVAVITPFQAQEVNYKGKFNIGAEGGVQFTNINSFIGPYTSQSKTGFYAGVFGEYNLSQSVKIKLGLQYDKRGFELDSYTLIPADSGASSAKSYYYYQVEYDMVYINIPLHIKYTRGSNKFKISLEGGVYYSIYLSANHKGVERYYFDSKDYFDLSESIFKEGLNDFTYDGSTDGIKRVYPYPAEGNPEEVSYVDYIFNSYDFGFDFLIGLVYQPTPSIGISIAPGFSYSVTKLLENPIYDTKWSQITKINLGFIYTLNMNKKKFGEK